MSSAPHRADAPRETIAEKVCAALYRSTSAGELPGGLVCRCPCSCASRAPCPRRWALPRGHHPAGLRRAAAARVARGTCGADYVLLFAGTEPALSLPDVLSQPEVDRDLALYQTFVGR